VLHGDGVHLITAQDTDAAGNVGTSSSITYTLNSITAAGGILEPLSAAQEIAAIYVGYFNRAPDNSGFSFWEGQFSQALNVGQSTDQALTNVSNAFEPQPETLALYPFLASGPLKPNSPNDVTGVENLIANIYSNLFDRTVDATTDAGAQYWVKQLLNNELGLGPAIFAIANGAQGADAEVVLNKVVVSNYFVADTQSAGPAVSSASVLAEARVVLTGVGADQATVAAAEAKIDAFFHV
jgi:hypothetical protein